MNANDSFFHEKRTLNQDPFTASSREKPNQSFPLGSGPKLANNQEDRTKHRQTAPAGRSKKNSKK
jgi:hypothetical protein